MRILLLAVLYKEGTKVDLVGVRVLVKTRKLLLFPLALAVFFLFEPVLLALATGLFPLLSFFNALLPFFLALGFLLFPEATLLLSFESP